MKVFGNVLLKTKLRIDHTAEAEAAAQPVHAAEITFDAPYRPLSFSHLIDPVRVCEQLPGHPDHVCLPLPEGLLGLVRLMDLKV